MGLIMLRLLLFIIFTFLLYSILNLLISPRSSSKKKDRIVEPEELVQDPFCQTYISKRMAVRKKVAGKVYYFCNQDCLQNYIRNGGQPR